MIGLKKKLFPIGSIAVLGAVLAAATALTGCQSSCTGDARFDGYYCARSNISNGTYSNQTAQLRQTAMNRQAKANELRQQYNRAQARLRAARSNRATPAADILRLEQEVDSLQRALNQYAG